MPSNRESSSSSFAADADDDIGFDSIRSNDSSSRSVSTVALGGERRRRHGDGGTGGVVIRLVHPLLADR